jgi:hypothetical protein
MSDPSYVSIVCAPRSASDAMTRKWVYAGDYEVVDGDSRVRRVDRCAGQEQHVWDGWLLEIDAVHSAKLPIT